MTGAPPPPTIAWHRRLEARVAGAISLLMAASLGAVLMTTTREVTTRSLDRATSDLEVARAAFYRLAADRAEAAAEQAALVTALPIFRSHMTDSRLAGDLAELQVLGEEYRGLMKADFCIVADRDGQWTAAPGWPAGGNPDDTVRKSVNEATAGRPQRVIAEVGDRLFLVVSEPARFGEEVLGTLTAGFALDDAMMKRLAEETHCDLALVANRHLVASSLDGADRSALASRTAAGDQRLQPGAAQTVERVGNGNYAIGAFPLSPAAQPGAVGSLLLLQNWAPTEDFIIESRRQILDTGLVVLVLALGVGLIFSRRVSRPLADLVVAANDIAGGNWERQVALRGGAEMSTLARAFNEMTTSLRHWYEEAKTRDDQFRQAQKMEAIGRLAGGVAHDFNNLLTAIKGYSELLNEDLAEDDPHREEVGEIIKAADRAAELTRQLLTFSRRQVVATRVLALNEIVVGTEHLLHRLIGEDIELTSTFPADTWPVRGDKGQIEQILVNLAVNARDAMPTGGSLHIELSNVVFDRETGRHHATLKPGRYVQLAMTDNGSGMDADTLARIFEPFFTTKEVGRGTGLGLAMVYGGVEQAGGAIDVDTAVGRGTTFRIYLPEATMPDGDDGAAATPAVLASLRGSETILLAEDDQRVSALVSRALTRAGYHLLIAPDGEHAMEIVRTHAGRIDLLLTDVVMPGMNGRELSEHVAAARPETRVLFMSGYSDDAILMRGIQTASAHFIQKPFAIDALAAKIRETLTATSSPRL